MADLPGEECISPLDSVPASASYTRTNKRKSCSLYQMALEHRFPGQYRVRPRWSGSFLRGRIEALTSIRKRRRIEGAYRINNIRQPDTFVLIGKFDHDRQSGAKRRRVNLGVGR